MVCERESMSEGKRSHRPCRSYPVCIPVRVSYEEQERIHSLAEATGHSASRYLVRLALEGRPPPTLLERQEVALLLFELRRIGVSLNQIAARINTVWATGKKIPLSVDELQCALSAVDSLSQYYRRRL